MVGVAVGVVVAVAVVVVVVVALVVQIWVGKELTMSGQDRPRRGYVVQPSSKAREVPYSWSKAGAARPDWMTDRTRLPKKPPKAKGAPQ